MKHENWAVQCPTDYATNEKWKEIVKWLNENDADNSVIKGGNEGDFYGYKNNKTCYTFNPSKNDLDILSIDEAHSMLFGNPVKYTIYQELVILAFKREALDDIVFFDIFGFHPYIMKKKVTKNSKLQWVFSIPELDYVEYWVDGIKVSTMKVDEVKEFLTKIESHGV